MQDLTILLQNREIEDIIFIDHSIENFILYPYNCLFINKQEYSGTDP